MGTLQLTYSELRSRIADYLGVGKSESDFSSNAASLALVDNSMLSGLRDFYLNAPDQKEGQSYNWSFLSIARSLQLIAGRDSYPLPDEFIELTEYFTWPEGTKKRPIGPVPSEHIRAMKAQDSNQGTPLVCAIRSRDTLDGQRTAKEVIFHPTPDADSALLLSYEMQSEPFIATGSYTTSYVPGGAVHADAIIECCLAAAERTANPEGGPGYHAGKAQELLMLAVEIDRKERAESADSWPIDGITAGVTSLAVTKSQLERLIGRAILQNPNPSTWTHGQATAVSEVLRNGLRKFYQPMPLPGDLDGHRWSFLTPTKFLDIVEGIDTYEMPEDFSGVIRGKMTYVSTGGYRYPYIKLVTDEQLRGFDQSSTTATYPEIAALKVKYNDPLLGTRYELQFWPTPSTDQQIRIPYAINPEQLGLDQSLPMGGQPHAQTLIEACLAAAEIQMNSGTTHQREFETCLRTSVSHDRSVSMPDTYGYSGDASDWEYDSVDDRNYGRMYGNNPLTTYNGASSWP